MILKTNLVPSRFDAITCYPFILVRPQFAGDKALLVHEMVHYQEQKKVFVIPWLLRYWLSQKFRLAAEVRGYKAQIQAGGTTREKAASMLTCYGLGVTYEEAWRLLK